MDAVVLFGGDDDVFEASKGSFEGGYWRSLVGFFGVLGWGRRLLKKPDA